MTELDGDKWSMADVSPGMTTGISQVKLVSLNRVLSTVYVILTCTRRLIVQTVSQCLRRSCLVQRAVSAYQRSTCHRGSVECRVIVNELMNDRSQRITAHHSLAPPIHTLLPPTYT